MSANDILKQAINLKPQERYILIENLIASLNEPDKDIEKLWIEESQKRLNQYNEGNLETVSYDEVFK